jgi:hypothetical protein
VRQINVGISVSATERTSIWDSGLNQNIAFMAMLFRAMPEVGKVFLINGGETAGLPPSLQFEGLQVPLVKPADVTYDVDLVIEMGASLPLEWMRHVNALGTRIAVLFVGHTYTGQIEHPMFGRAGGSAFIGTPWHEVWTLPQHMKTSGPMLRTIARVPVHEVPHIWSPMFLQKQVGELDARGLEFGFHPRPGEPWRTAIFEPNISVVKSSFIPMLVCDAAYRRRPESIGLMMVMNTFHMKEHPTFNRFATHLNLTRDSKASYEPRLAFAECMVHNRIDAVVAHQWECGLNYAYYDALHGGYPLVHNSEFLAADGVGLYYPGFRAAAGGQVLLDAWARDAAYWDDYRVRAARYLSALDPAAPAKVAAYRRRILELMGDRVG